MDQKLSYDDHLFYDDSFYFAQEELEITTSNSHDTPESNNSTSSPQSQDNFSDSNSLFHPDYFEFDLLNQPTDKVSLDDCLIDIGISNLDDETCADSLIADLLGDMPADQMNQNVMNPGFEYNNQDVDIVDLNSNEFYQICENTPTQKKSSYNQDFLIEMDDDYDEDDMSSVEFTYSPQNDSSEFGINSRKSSLVSRPTKRTRNKCRSLPYTVHDLPQCQSLNNEDIVEGKPGERIHLSHEEVKFFKQEGLAIPTHLPLTKEELRALKTVRRKIRNKISAKNSRAKKQDYIFGLEKRVTVCNEENIHLKKKMNILESDNKSLLSQVRHLRDMLRQYAPQQKLSDSSKPSLCLCMITFMMLFMPYLMPGMMVPVPGQEGSTSLSIVAPSPASRRLLQERDLSMNLGDPYDITVRPSPAWKYPPQSPVVSPLNKDSSLRVMRSNESDNHQKGINNNYEPGLPSSSSSSYSSMQSHSTEASTINLNTKEFIKNNNSLWQPNLEEKL